MTRILTIIFLFFSSSVWSGEVDGNSFYCKKGPKNIWPVALEFKNGMVRHFSERIVDGGPMTLSYSSFPTYIEWGGELHFELNRKTLVMKQIGKRQKSYGEVFVDVFQWECEFMKISKAHNLIREHNKKQNKMLRKGNKF